MEETNHNVFSVISIHVFIQFLSHYQLHLYHCIFEIWSTICQVLGWHHVKPLSEIFVENGSKCWRHRRNGSLFLVVDQEPVCAENDILDDFVMNILTCTDCHARGQSTSQLGPPPHSSRCRQGCCVCHAWPVHSHLQLQQHAVQAAGVYHFLLW